ncbi:MAG: segregation/condensation protein A [Candidatus Buchananbacteria bacterium]|nr:segregation/condensation protein A [Candidatus Buchananbacteria bacterium]
MHKIKINQFEGPLDLLLQLIEQQKLTITEVSLAEVTEQYIQILHRESNGLIPAVQLADFLMIAARLLLIKSRALLPFLQWEDEETEELTSQLKIYKEYLEASKVIQSLIGKKRFNFSREHLLTETEITFSPPPKLTAVKLHEIFAQVLKALEPVVNLPTDVVKRTINIQEKIEQIRTRIFSQASTRFSEILKDAKDKTEVVVSFLALLELVKQKIVLVNQQDNFSDILIEKLN